MKAVVRCVDLDATGGLTSTGPSSLWRWRTFPTVDLRAQTSRSDASLVGAAADDVFQAYVIPKAISSNAKVSFLVTVGFN